MGYQSKYTGAEIDNLLDKAGTALQNEQYTGTVTGVRINGTTKSPLNGIVDLGEVAPPVLALNNVNAKTIQFSVETPHVLITHSGTSTIGLNFTNVTAAGYCRITIIRLASCTINIPVQGTSRIRFINTTSSITQYATAQVSANGVAPITLMWVPDQQCWIGYVGL